MGSAASKYPTMATTDICTMPISNIITENAVLFLWTTNPLLLDAVAVTQAWGFDYKTKLTWDKREPTYGPLGNYGYSRTEDLWICTKGSLLPVEKPVLFLSEGKTAHSKKPDTVRGLIERMYPGMQYIELFAREHPHLDNWTFWGIEEKGLPNAAA